MVAVTKIKHKAMVKQATINKVVNFDKENNEVKILDYLFSDGSNFHGATGTKFEIISREQYNKTLEPYLDNPKETLKYFVENFGGVPPKMIDNMGLLSTEYELRKLFFDDSCIELWDYMREELGLSEDEAYIFNCVGGGRCFKNDEVFNYNKKYQKYVKMFESENADTKELIKIIDTLNAKNNERK